MATHSTRALGDFFGDKWPLYQRAIRGNLLCHDEMLALLDQCLTERLSGRPFCFADFGCGDGTAVLNVLRSKPLAEYTGVDASSDLIARADQELAELRCKKTLICEDMAIAIEKLSGPFDVIFCSYSLHHLLSHQKINFIHGCFERLNSPGYFIMADGVRRENETRDEWLNRLNLRFYEKLPDFTPQEIGQIMQHPWEYDYPDSISTFRQIWQKDPWRNFEVLFHRDEILAMLVFTK